jgi:3-isopropylmalate/(R)-2-methylmalate dehydratase small subunit
MDPFTTLAATAVPLAAANIDTDQIIPARFLRVPRREGYAGFLFHDQRRTPEGNMKPDFVLNDPAYSGAAIIVAGENFGCGSSREGAVYALLDAGFRCVLAPSFGDIFFNNCFKNGVLAARLPHDVITALQARLAAQPGLRIVVDLPTQTITVGNDAPIGFEIDAFRKMSLTRGLDDISLTREHAPEIAAFEQRRRAAEPWLSP